MEYIIFTIIFSSTAYGLIRILIWYDRSWLKTKREKKHPLWVGFGHKDIKKKTGQ